MVDARQADERDLDAAAPAMAGVASTRASALQFIRERLAAGLRAGALRRRPGHKNGPAVQTGANAGDALRAGTRGNPRRTKWRRAPRAYHAVT